MTKTILLLIGPKGCGKTHIGELLEKNLGIKFLSVEPYFIQAKKNHADIDEEYFAEAWKGVRAQVDKIFDEHDMLSMESLGTFPTFRSFLKELQDKFDIKLIQIKSPLDLCMKRIKQRDSDKHVEMSHENIEMVNNMVLKEKYDFVLIIDNKNMSDDKIIEKIKSLI